MSQHDYVFANQTGASLRADMNLQSLAVVSQNSGATEPTTMYAYMIWEDTTTGITKRRNAGNTAWIAVRGGNTTIASATTPDIFGAAGNLINYTGTTTCTGLVAAPFIGAYRTIFCAAAAPFTAGANLTIDGISSGVTFVAYAGQVIDLYAITTTTFKLVPRTLAGVWVTPTHYSVLNVAASTSQNGMFSISNGICTFALSLNCQATATGAVELGIAIGEGSTSPPASNFTTVQDASGTAVSQANGVAGDVVADITNDRLTLRYVAIDTTNRSFKITGQYRLL